MNFSEVDQVINSGVEQGVFPGVAVLVSQGGEVRYRRACGWRSLEPERTPLAIDMIYDTASLTKPLATSVALMLLVAEHKLSLDDRVARFLPDFAAPEKTAITVRQLLSHASGLPAWRRYYRDLIVRPNGPEVCHSEPECNEGEESRVAPASLRFLVAKPVLSKVEGFLGMTTLQIPSARAEIYARVLREPLEAPPGSRAVYSDVGFILLGGLVESLSGLPLDQYCDERIFHPLQLHDTGFLNLERLTTVEQERQKQRFVPTERCPWRDRILCAEVHDENAYAMGGVAGHAGLFSTVDDLDRLVSCLLTCYRGTDTFLPAAVVREFWTRDGRVPGSTWALGWDTPSPQQSSAGTWFSTRSVGHLGFTGTSIWIDLERDVQVIVLSNRVHPRRDNTKIRGFRPALHNAVMRAVLGKS